MTMFAARRLLLAFAWLFTMACSLVAGAYGHKHRARIRALLHAVQDAPVITTNLHMLKVQKIVVPAEGRDGGIAAVGDGILLVNRLGRFWFIDSEKQPHPLPFQVPLNVDELESDPANAKLLYPELFGVKDIAVQEIPGGVRVLASHSHWHSGQSCNTLRVSSLETTREALLSGTAESGTWRTVFETTPCRPLERAPNGSPRVGLGAGGRIAPMPDGGVLLSVGGFDPENELVLQAPQKLDNSYGKTIWIDPAKGTSRIYTIGHRNPQGLAVGSDGRIWLSEHAARGGDELNLLVEAGNYGYPRVAYGTQYDEMSWPLSSRQGRHDEYEKPMFAWVPSIATSQLMVLEGTAFPHWQGDLIVSTLAAQSLYRVRVEDDRAIFVEPIPIGHRIRDIVEAGDGSIVLKTDDNFLVYMTPLDAASAATPTERGAILAANCQACHGMTPESGAGIGPSLWGIVGRPVASVDNFIYSDGLRSVDGRWTPDRLRRFLADPESFAPGTIMQATNSYDDDELSDLISYLQTLR